MATLDVYERQAQLVVRVLPVVSAVPQFALKGGTAINLFVRNMPRMSVDIDLVYLPIEDRVASLKGIESGLRKIASEIESRFEYSVSLSKRGKEQIVTRLIVDSAIENESARIKVEVSPVLRGSVHEPGLKTITQVAENQFGFAEVNLLHFDDLYAGKLCAALDRQHPRDLFDVKLLLAEEEISEQLKNTFLVYLISHDRPIAELLDPQLQPLQEKFEREFDGMTSLTITREDLEEVREVMIYRVRELLDTRDREFLLAFKSGEPDWTTFYYPEAEHLPAVRWKLQNIAKMTKEAHRTAVEKLAAVLEQI